MTFYELYKKIDTLYPKSLSCEWDNDGIMCMSNPDNQVKKVLISLDITEDVVDFAIKECFDTIISHHPLVFKSQKSLSIENYTQRKLIKLIKANINVMSFHTRLDAGSNGVNDTLCKALGYKDTITDEIDPIGRIFTLNEAKTLSLFANEVKEKLSSPCVLYSGNKDVKKVYVVGGDGKDLIDAALANGADTLLTGRASYNTMVDAKDIGINIIEAGHFFTENPVCSTIENIVHDLDGTVKTHKYFSNNIEIIK